MQPVGILLLTAGVWLVYSGVVGIQPLVTLQEIIAKPNQASKIIAGAKAASPSLTVPQVADSAVKRNPFSRMTVSADFEKHKARNSGWPGIDFVAPVGTPIISPVTGTLRNDPASGNGGYAVYITTASGVTHIFAHLSRFRADLNGKTIKAGQVAGWSGGAKGATGSGNSTGPHIHYSIRMSNGTFIDPLPWLNGPSDKRVFH